MPNATDILLSGLNSFQGGLATTSNNIANAATEGYTRQRINIASLPSQREGPLYFGSGARIASIERINSEFVTAQLRGASSETSRLDAISNFSSRVDNLLADGDGNLSATLQSFFEGLQDLSIDPNSGPARQIVISNAESLVNRFASLESQLGSVSNDINSSIGVVVEEINALTSEIADLNVSISQAAARTTNSQPPNDLIDQREFAILRLSELTNTTVVPVEDGTLSVFIGSGQSAVVGDSAQKFAVTADAYDPTRTSVGLVVGNNTIDVSSQLAGGQLAGLFEVRDQIDGYQNSLGRIATVLADTFNQQHRQGITVDGEFGEDFFSSTATEVFNHTSNSGAGTFTAYIVDVSQLTASDYQIRFDGSNYTVTRLNDGQSQTSAAGVFTMDGVEFSLQGTVNVGDQFLVRPVRAGARDLSLLVHQPNELATASPVRSLANISNIGDAVISAPSVTDVTNPDLRDTVEIRFDSAANSYDLVNVTDSVTIASGVPYSSGSTISVNGIEVSIEGEPQIGDVFRIENNLNGVTDNTNVVALQNLQTDKTLLGGISYQEAYGSLVGEVGATTRQSQISGNAQRRTLEDAIQARENISGVNLDEEAINLVRYQQAYQAAARAISVTNNLFQSILAAIN